MKLLILVALGLAGCATRPVVGDSRPCTVPTLPPDLMDLTPRQPWLLPTASEHPTGE